MKETRFFYVPNPTPEGLLPDDEAMHAVRVLRLRSGDDVVLQDGRGTFYKAVIDEVAPRRCSYRIIETSPQQPLWRGSISIAIAPTKIMDRMEWMTEKATEIGIDHIHLLSCDCSERRVAKTERLDKIVVAAMKQSRKAWRPVVHEIKSFKQFIAENTDGLRFIAHCHDHMERKYLFDELRKCIVGAEENLTILIGPEGDFSEEEVDLAIKNGYVPVSLGQSRLRTETAALAALMMVHLAQDKKNKHSI